AQRQCRILRRRLESDGGPGLLLSRRLESAEGLRTVPLRHAPELQPRDDLRAAIRKSARRQRDGCEERCPGWLDPEQHFPGAQRPANHRLRWCRAVAAGDTLTRAAEPRM